MSTAARRAVRGLASSTRGRIKGVVRRPTPAATPGSPPPNAAAPPPLQPTYDAEWMESDERTARMDDTDRALYKKFAGLMVLSAVCLTACEYKINRDARLEQEAFAEDAAAWSRRVADSRASFDMDAAGAAADEMRSEDARG